MARRLPASRSGFPQHLQVLRASGARGSGRAPSPGARRRGRVPRRGLRQPGGTKHGDVETHVHSVNFTRKVHDVNMPSCLPRTKPRTTTEICGTRWSRPASASSSAAALKRSACARWRARWACRPTRRTVTSKTAGVADGDRGDRLRAPVVGDGRGHANGSAPRRRKSPRWHASRRQRAHVELVQETPAALRADVRLGRARVPWQPRALLGPSPWALLGQVLDELVDDQVMSKTHRTGAELHVGPPCMASPPLAHSGPLTALGPKARTHRGAARLHSRGLRG